MQTFVCPDSQAYEQINNLERDFMKKQLLSTSALVAAGFVVSTLPAIAQTAPAASPITVTLGGFSEQLVSWSKLTNSLAGSSTTATGKVNSFGQSSDTEIYFNAKTTLANGISLSVRVELEGNTATDQIDESWLNIQSGFGEVHLGSTDNAAQKMRYGAPSAFMDSGGIAQSFPNIASTGSFGSTVVGKSQSNSVSLNDDDNSKISYYTPRFEGFQAGISYIPENAQDRNASGLATGGYHDGVFGAVNFVRTFGEFDVAAYLGYGKWSKPKDSSTFSAAANGVQDPKMWSFGGQVGYAGFKVGVGYARVKDQRLTTQTAGANSTAITGFLNDGNVWEYGITYTFGPATVGASYGRGVSASSTANSGGDSQEYVTLDGDYKLGTGVRTGVRLSSGQVKGEIGALTNGRDPDNFKFTDVTWGIKLDF